MKDLSFWAQSLDNQAPDVIIKDGEELSDDESRQKLVSEIYEIPKSSIEVVPANSVVTIRYSHPKFVIEAIPTEKDRANRLAPIVIYGVIPDDFSEPWVKDVCDEIESSVSTKLKRTLDNSALMVIHDWLSKTLKKKAENPQFNLYDLLKRSLERLVDGFKILVNKLLREIQLLANKFLRKI